MKLIITEVEIAAIVRAHVLDTVQMKDGSDIKIDFSATRGTDGIVATIDIPYMGVGSIDLDEGKDKPQGAAAPTPPATAPKVAAKSKAAAVAAPVTKAEMPAAGAAAEPTPPKAEESPFPVDDTTAITGDTAGDAMQDLGSQDTGGDTSTAGSLFGS